jgi:predicted metal-dependent hydrolase
LGGQRIEYTVVKGKGRRYTYFRFRPDAMLEIVSPRPKSLDAESIIRQRESWVLKHREELSQASRVLDDGSVMFDGKRLKLVFVQTSGREGLRPDLDRGTAVVTAHDRSSIRELVRRWFLKETSAYVVRTLPELAKRLAVQYRRADVREIKNWGYCTRDGRLSFSWQLIALPTRVREYVLLHELVHLAEHNHSPSFRRRLATILPDFRDRERELDAVVPI